MMKTHWSWIFILYALQLGSAAVSDSVYTANGISLRDDAYESNSYTVEAPAMSRSKVGVLVGCVAGGIALSFAVLGWCFVSRSRRVATHIEDGVTSPGQKKGVDGWFPVLKSEFSPDEKSTRSFDRIREALSRRGAKKPQQSILPVYQVSLPTGSTDSIERPLPVVPHEPRYPSMLERGYSKRSHPPPLTLQSQSDQPHTSYSLHVTEGQDRSSRRKIQVPPKVLLVPPGRSLPGFARSQSAGLRLPKSPSRRRSWLSKHPLKHPFIPVQDSSLKFPPGSPLYPGQYHPSRWQLEARLVSGSPLKEATSSWVGSSSAKEVPQTERDKQQPAPLSKNDGQTTKQARLVGALQTGSNGRRVPVPKTPNTSRLPPASRHPLQDPPTTAYI